MITLNLNEDELKRILTILNRAMQDANLKIKDQDEYLVCMKLANEISKCLKSA